MLIKNLLITKRLDKNPNTKTTYILNSVEYNIISDVQYESITSKTTCAYFKKLNSSQTRITEMTNAGNRVTKLYSISPNKQMKIIRTFKLITMLTKDNLTFYFDDLTKSQIEAVFNSNIDRVVLRLEIFNAGASAMLESLTDKDDVEELEGCGMIVCDKDQFLQLFNESKSTNKHIKEYL